MGAKWGVIFDRMIPTSPWPSFVTASFVSMVGGVVDVLGGDGGESSTTFSPVCPAALPHGALVSQVLAGYAASSRRLAPNRQPA